MKVEQLRVDPEHARELWQKYKTHVNYQTPADAEISAIYKRIAQGKTVIRALESIRVTGLNEQGLPKLAIMRADEPKCYWHAGTNEGVFANTQHWYSWGRQPARGKVLKLEWPDLPQTRGRTINEAIVPLIPVHLRPRRGLANYHILWEAEWTRRYPVDPYLLRRFGGDAWLVVAAWDLTDVERAVMANRLRN